MPAGSYVKRMPWGQQKPLLGYGIDWSHPLANEIVGCWLFNEGAGAVVNDLVTSSKGSMGTYKWQNGLVHPINNTDNIDLRVRTDIPSNSTLVAMISQSSLYASTQDSEIFGRAGSSGARGPSMQYSNVSSVLRVQFYIATNATTQTQLYGGSFLNAIGIKKHIVCTYVPSTSMTIYVDGAFVAENKTSIPAASYMPAVNWRVGTRFGGPSGFLNQDVILALLYNRALSATEVAALYAEPYCFIEGWNYGRSYSIPSSAFINSPFWYQNPIMEAI